MRIIVGYRENYKLLIANRKASGRCRCGNTPITNKKQCEKCAIAAREYQATRRKQRALLNLCVTCGNPSLKTKTACSNCAKRATEHTIKRYNANKAAGTCAFCGNTIGSKSKFRCDNCHDLHLRHGKIQWHRQRLIVIKHYGGKCVCCGESNNRFIEIDHINNDGKKHRRVTGRHIYKWVINQNFPSDLQLLCANCNRSKGKFGVCQHIKEPLTPFKQERRQLRLFVITNYGGKCTCCGETHWTFLEFDHINNDGKKHRSINILQHIITNKFPKDIQLLCSNCNKAKGLYGWCPHQARAPSKC